MVIMEVAKQCAERGDRKANNCFRQYNSVCKTCAAQKKEKLAMQQNA